MNKLKKTFWVERQLMMSAVLKKWHFSPFNGAPFLLVCICFFFSVELEGDSLLHFYSFIAYSSFLLNGCLSP